MDLRVISKSNNNANMTLVTRLLKRLYNVALTTSEGFGYNYV